MALEPSRPAQPWALQLLLALAAGGAQAASLAWPWGGQPLWWLQLLSLGVLAALVRPLPHASGGSRAPHSGRRGALMGALMGGAFALAWLAGTFWWLFISMHTYGGLAAPLAVLAVLGLAGFLALYYAAAAALYCRIAPVNKGWAALLFAMLWMLAELARGQWWTGFPWGAGGYAHVEGPLSVFARSVGVYGVGAIAAGLAMALVQWRPSDLRRGGFWVALLAAALVWPAAGWQQHCAANGCTEDAPQAPSLSVALLQGNIPQDEKFQPGSGVPMALRWYEQSLREARADLVVAPETAIPLLPQQLVPGYLERVRLHFAQSPQAALVGIPLGSEAQGYTNSVIAVTPEAGQAPWSAPAMPPGAAQRAGALPAGWTYRYDKHHLVPFGEFIPPLFRWFTEMMNIPLGDFSRGSVGQASLAFAGQRIAPNICYEDLFGEELGARFRDPAQAPTIMVNLSNIGWFGNTVAIDQHLQISRMRALEFERPMVRATNTGATAVIDHRGVVTHALERHTRGVLLASVQGRGLDAGAKGAMTPYAIWVSRAGLWPLWVLGLLVVAFVPFAQRGRRAPRRLAG